MGRKFDLAIKRSKVNLTNLIDMKSPILYTCTKIQPKGFLGVLEKKIFMFYHIWAYFSLKSFTTLIIHCKFQPLVFNTFWKKRLFTVFSIQIWPYHKKVKRSTYDHHLNKLGRPWALMLFTKIKPQCFSVLKKILVCCVEVLLPSQPNGVMSSAVITKECCRHGGVRTRNLLITSWMRIQLSHWGLLEKKIFKCFYHTWARRHFD